MPLEPRGSSAKKPDPQDGDNAMRDLNRKLFGSDQPKTPMEAADRLEAAVERGDTTPQEILGDLEKALGENGKLAVEAATDYAKVTKMAYDVMRTGDRDAEAQYKAELLRLARESSPEKVALFLGMGAQAMIQLAITRKGKQ